MHSNLAGQYMIRNQLDLAAEEYQAALRINPDFPDALAFYSQLEYRRGNYQSAGVMMEKAFHMSGRNNPNYDFMLVNFASILTKTNHADGALELLDREIVEQPSYAPAWACRAELHLADGKLDDARADAEAALRLDASNVQAREVLSGLSISVPAASRR
jgi:tetratricopeptide (TPR) repeat protein